MNWKQILGIVVGVVFILAMVMIYVPADENGVTGEFAWSKFFIKSVERQKEGLVVNQSSCENKSVWDLYAHLQQNYPQNQWGKAFQADGYTLCKYLGGVCQGVMEQKNTGITIYTNISDYNSGVFFLGNFSESHLTQACDKIIGSTEKIVNFNKLILNVTNATANSLGFETKYHNVYYAKCCSIN